MVYNIYIIANKEGKMDTIAKLKNISEKNGAVITATDAKLQGISRAVLSNLSKQGKLQRISHGQYILPDTLEDELFAVSLRSDKMIFSHETALFLHGISDRTPFIHSLTVPTGYVPSPAIREICKIRYIKPELYELGKTELLTPGGNKVPAYDIERTICDIIRSRSSIGTETFIAALKEYVKCPDKNLNLLNNYAKQMRVEGIVRRYLEVLL